MFRALVLPHSRYQLHTAEHKYSNNWLVLVLPANHFPSHAILINASLRCPNAIGSQFTNVVADKGIKSEGPENPVTGTGQWWGHSPPTNVARDRFPDSTPYEGWVCCWFSSLPERFFSGFPGFPLSSKTNISKFQFDPDSSGRIATPWRCHLNSHYYYYYYYYY